VVVYSHPFDGHPGQHQNESWIRIRIKVKVGSGSRLK
jgi:hypothetical protein